MLLINFIAKAICLTCCLWALLYCFYPRYERIGDGLRFDTLTGHTEVYMDCNGIWAKCRK